MGVGVPYCVTVEVVSAWNLFDMLQIEQNLLVISDPSKPYAGMRRTTTFRSTTVLTNDDGPVRL